MAVIDQKGNETYVGVVLDLYSHFYYDGMEQEYAKVWDINEHKIKYEAVGYYGSDGANLSGKTAEIDITPEIVKDMIDTYRIKACRVFEKSVLNYKQKIQKGIKVQVVRGRKVKQGTILDLFWVGERPNYIGRQELLAGGYTEDGQKVWIKAEYLKNITEIKSSNAKERKKFIKAYIRDQVSRNLLEACTNYKIAFKGIVYANLPTFSDHWTCKSIKLVL